MLCEEESANSSHILKISEPGQRNMLSSNTVVVASPGENKYKEKKLNRTPGERENLAPYDYFDQKCRRADKIDTF